MQVRHILQEKGRDVVTIAQNATMADAAKSLSRHRIGALVVLRTDSALAGILSERDLVRAIAADGVDVLGRGVDAYMSRHITTCSPDDTVEDLMEMMTHGRFRHVPVLNARGRLDGMISIGDVVKTRITETVNEANSLRDYIATAI